MSSENVPAYPLAWPPDRPRHTCTRKPTSFRSGGKSISLVDARARLSKQLVHVHAAHVVLSTNVELRLDGNPRAGGKEPDDPGAACYFKLQGQFIVLACDRWDTVAGNIAAIAAHIEALRGQERWGVGTVEEGLAGFVALPPPNNWRDLLDNPRTRADAERAYRKRARVAHPDAGGSTERMAALNAAFEAAQRALPN